MVRPALQDVQVSRPCAFGLSQVLQRPAQAEPTFDMTRIEAERLPEQCFRTAGLASLRKLLRETAARACQRGFVLGGAPESFQRILVLPRFDEQVTQPQVGPATRAVDHKRVPECSESGLATSLLAQCLAKVVPAVGVPDVDRQRFFEAAGRMVDLTRLRMDPPQVRP